MNYNDLSKGYEILYKYTDGTSTKFRTTGILKSKSEVNDKLTELYEFEGFISAVVRTIRYCENVKIETEA